MKEEPTWQSKIQRQKRLVHKGIILGDLLEHLLFAGFHKVPSNDHFFQYEGGLVKVENQIELAHVAKVLVKYFDKMMYHI
jgi:hypothetical protein